MHVGLLDVFTGMANGPRGGGFGMGRGSGTSPILLAALGLLAYKAVKGMGTAAPQNQFRPNPSSAAADTGGLGSILQNLGLGGLGGPSSAGGLGGILSGGLGDLVRQFQNAGKGDVADSWVRTGDNKTIAPTDLGKVLTPEQIAFLTERTGLTREELLQGLSEQLPEVVDRMTPQGRLPAPHDFDHA
jgi:uncharacterized protein YidB (DUF937 family)